MAAQVKDSKSPATTSSAYDFMAPRWNLIETLLAGTEAMREAGELYLPRHPEETNDGYACRLQATVLLNMTDQTLDTLKGKPFSEEVKLNDDIPERIVDEVAPDVDLQGNSLAVFTQEWFREGLAKGFCHVLVDMPRPTPRADGQPRTLADDRSEGVRPYWVLIKPECELFARAEIIDGREVLKHVRIMECYTEQDGFAEVHKTRIRVLEPGKVELWEPHPTKKRDGQPVWVKAEEWETGIDKIPYVTFYANREGFRISKPPLLDLAHLNVEHWQSKSDQRHVLTVARFPILACSGASGEDSDPVVVGPNKVLYNEDPQGQFYYVEHTGAAIEAGRQDLQDLEEKMSAYGAQFLNKKSGDPTATARALDAAEQTSELASMTIKFEDAVAQALDLTAEWMKLPNGEGGTIELVKDYDVVETDAPGLDALQKARDSKNISREAYLTGLKLRGVLPEDFDPEEDAELLEQENAAALAAGAAMLELDPNAPKETPPSAPAPALAPSPAPAPAPAPAPPAPGGKKPPRAAVKKAAAKKAPAKAAS